MRILILAAAILATGPAAAGAPPPARAKFAPPPANCPAASRYHATTRAHTLRPQRLAELPPADHYKAAYRIVGGCEVPIVAGFRPTRQR